MANEGENITRAVSEAWRFYTDVGQLAKTADELMDKEGWKPAWGTNTSTLSSSINWIDDWVAQDIYRYYRNDDYKHVWACISVIIFDREVRDRVTQPLVSAAWADWGRSNEAATLGESERLNHRHVIMPGTRLDGEWVTAEAAQWPEQKPKFLRVSTMAVPLVEINSSDDLKNRIVGPLIKRIKENC